jgi:hypothetical protein
LSTASFNTNDLKTNPLVTLLIAVNTMKELMPDKNMVWSHTVG